MFYLMGKIIATQRAQRVLFLRDEVKADRHCRETLDLKKLSVTVEPTKKATSGFNGVFPRPFRLQTDFFFNNENKSVWRTFWRTKKRGIRKIEEVLFRQKSKKHPQISDWFNVFQCGLFEKDLFETSWFKVNFSLT